MLVRSLGAGTKAYQVVLCEEVRLRPSGVGMRNETTLLRGLRVCSNVGSVTRHCRPGFPTWNAGRVLLMRCVVLHLSAMTSVIPSLSFGDSNGDFLNFQTLNSKPNCDWKQAAALMKLTRENVDDAMDPTLVKIEKSS